MEGVGAMERIGATERIQTQQGVGYLRARGAGTHGEDDGEAAEYETPRGGPRGGMVLVHQSLNARYSSYRLRTPPGELAPGAV
jgi:hypothetical protein